MAGTGVSATSQLWGGNGENWTPQGRLPDFSNAGYRRGETPPDLPRGINVRDFGAIGDGVADDTAAFQKAIAAAEGAIEIPPGRYVITDILEITRPGIVLRGAGPGETVLVCPVPLQEIRPNWTQTSGGRKTSAYSWSGGMVRIRGEAKHRPLAQITGAAKRGDRQFEVDSTEALQPGDEILLFQKDTEENSLAAHLYSGDPGDDRNLTAWVRVWFACKIAAVDNNTITIDRPLRFDIREEWQPVVRDFNFSVRDSGVENLAFEFPEQPYGGHFTELGHNAIAINNASDCWVRNVRILNADSGIFLGGFFCTVDGLVLESNRTPDSRGNTGHHGVTLSGNDNLLQNFDIRTLFIHDLTVTGGAGNVAMAGRGDNLCLDHHKRAPYENLFTDLDAGKGTRLWASGGGAGRGRHAAGRNTYWNIRAERPLPRPASGFAPASINLVGLFTDFKEETDPNGAWFEVFEGGKVTPPNLYEAQREKWHRAP